MMMKQLTVIMGLSVSIGVSAADIYGLNERDTQTIMKKYEKVITEFDKAIQKVNLKENSDALQREVSEKKRAIMETLTKDNGYLFVDVAPIYYPEDNRFYTTIEIVDKYHPKRLQFISQEATQPTASGNRTHPPDLIESMIRYNETSVDLMMHDQIKIIPPCPVYHCTLGFEDPTLKPYLSIFNNGATQERSMILEALRSDPDPERRAAAAFLVGHFNDPHDIISILSSYVEDKDEKVRNNSMRVIGATIGKAKIRDIDIRPFLNVLDSPISSDRNKALMVLRNVAESHATHHLILQEAGHTLLNLIRLKQPNNHDWAYQILKKVSGRDFGPTNIAAWKAWVAASRV